MADIRSGLLQEKITIQKRTVNDNNGDIISSWEDFAAVHAYANGLSGNELIEARKVNQENSIKFTVRYSKKLSKLNPQDYRIIWRGEVFKILPPIDNFKFQNQTLQLTAICYDVGGVKNG